MDSFWKRINGRDAVSTMPANLVSLLHQQNENDPNVLDKTLIAAYALTHPSWFADVIRKSIRKEYNRKV